MRSCKKIYTITEYNGFSRGTAFAGYQVLPEKTFDELEALILENNKNTQTEALELFSLSFRRNIGKVITARNYVGLITMSDGTVIEILPKIASRGITESETKQIFLEMLKTLNDVKFKDFNVSNLHIEKLSLLEIFIKMFLNEVTLVTKQGLKSAYTFVEQNENFYKGKLLASQNIKYNLVNKERFFVRYDELNINRPENRLIKSTLRFLLKTTNDMSNHQHTTRLLTFFDRVEYSLSFDSDFSKCYLDRNTNHYEKILSWCSIMLYGKSFTAFSGSEVAFALLFPMEKIFEDFVAAKFRKHIGSDINIRTQDTRYSLFTTPNRSFSLRPDIVMEFNDRIIILDTKWKLLKDNVKNSGISESDMYQMYVYSKKYTADAIVLLYPQSDSVSRKKITYSSDDNVKVDVSFIDLRNADESISEILSKLIKR